MIYYSMYIHSLEIKYKKYNDLLREFWEALYYEHPPKSANLNVFSAFWAILNFRSLESGMRLLKVRACLIFFWNWTTRDWTSREYAHSGTSWPHQCYEINETWRSYCANDMIQKLHCWSLDCRQRLSSLFLKPPRLPSLKAWNAWISIHAPMKPYTVPIAYPVASSWSSSLTGATFTCNGPTICTGLAICKALAIWTAFWI